MEMAASSTTGRRRSAAWTAEPRTARPSAGRTIHRENTAAARASVSGAASPRSARSATSGFTLENLAPPRASKRTTRDARPATALSLASNGQANRKPEQAEAEEPGEGEAEGAEAGPRPPSEGGRSPVALPLRRSRPRTVL